METDFNQLQQQTQHNLGGIEEVGSQGNLRRQAFMKQNSALSQQPMPTSLLSPGSKAQAMMTFKPPLSTQAAAQNLVEHKKSFGKGHSQGGSHSAVRRNNPSMERSISANRRLGKKTSGSQVPKNRHTCHDHVMSPGPKDKYSNPTQLSAQRRKMLGENLNT